MRTLLVAGFFEALEVFKWVIALLLILLVDAGDNINLLQVIIRFIDSFGAVI